MRKRRRHWDDERGGYPAGALPDFCYDDDGTVNWSKIPQPQPGPAPGAQAKPAVVSLDEIQRVHHHECLTSRHHYDYVEEFGKDGPVALRCTHCWTTWSVGPAMDPGA